MLAKAPYTYRGHHEATTDPGQIRAWFTEWPNALVGVNAGMSQLVTADIDMGEDKHGNTHDGWASLAEEGLDDLPETFHYTTNRGGSHYIYEPSDGRFLAPTKDHATPSGVILDSVDRRAGSSYFIWWGDEVPVARDAFGIAPEWLMTVSEEIGSAPFMGSVNEWIDKCAPGEPEPFLVEWVDNIPKGDFGHPDMIQMQAALIGHGAAGRAGVPWALNRLHEAWVRPPYNLPEYERDWQISLAMGVEKFGAFEADILGMFAPPAPPPGDDIDYVAAAMTILTDGFFELWTGLPANPTPEALVERVRRVLNVALEDGGVTRREAVEVAWECAARKAEGCPIVDREGVEALASSTFLDEPAPVLEAPSEQPAPTEAVVVDLAPKGGVDLLSPVERLRLQDLHWWGDEFMERMGEVNPVMSEQFYRMNRWFILSLLFADRVVIPSLNSTRLLLNFYGITLGPSGIGKSESLNPVKQMLKHFYVDGDSPDIGGNATEAGMTRALIRLDGKTSFFHSDEADRILLAWGDKMSAFAGMKQFMTEVYGGTVPAIQRAGQQDISGIQATAYLSAHLTGIDERISDAIDPHDWESGFINRFIFAKGYRKKLTREQKRFPLARSGGMIQVSSVDKWYAQWSANFRAIAERNFSMPDGEARWMDFEDAVLDRHVDLLERFEAMASDSDYPERLRPTFTRLHATVLKCAALVAITRKSAIANMDDYLIALEQVEEWVDNALEMVAATDESPRSRQVERVAAYIKRQGGSCKRSAIHAAKMYRGDQRHTNSLIDELIAQGRVESMAVGKGEALIRLIDENGFAL